MGHWLRFAYSELYTSLIPEPQPIPAATQPIGRRPDNRNMRLDVSEARCVFHLVESPLFANAHLGFEMESLDLSFCCPTSQKTARQQRSPH
jgi:hypothetical protein